jgi:hypothetical protein
MPLLTTRFCNACAIRVRVRARVFVCVGMPLRLANVATLKGACRSHPLWDRRFSHQWPALREVAGCGCTAVAVNPDHKTVAAYLIFRDIFSSPYPPCLTAQAAGHMVLILTSVVGRCFNDHSHHHSHMRHRGLLCCCAAVLLCCCHR